MDVVLCLHFPFGNHMLGSGGTVSLWDKGARTRRRVSPHLPHLVGRFFASTRDEFSFVRHLPPIIYYLFVRLKLTAIFIPCEVRKRPSEPGTGQNWLPGQPDLFVFSPILPSSHLPSCSCPMFLSLCPSPPPLSRFHLSSPLFLLPRVSICMGPLIRPQPRSLLAVFSCPLCAVEISFRIRCLLLINERWSRKTIQNHKVIEPSDCSINADNYIRGLRPLPWAPNNASHGE